MSAFCRFVYERPKRREREREHAEPALAVRMGPLFVGTSVTVRLSVSDMMVLVLMLGYVHRPCMCVCVCFCMLFCLCVCVCFVCVCVCFCCFVLFCVCVCVFVFVCWVSWGRLPSQLLSPVLLDASLGGHKSHLDPCWLQFYLLVIIKSPIRIKNDHFLYSPNREPDIAATRVG